MVKGKGGASITDVPSEILAKAANKMGIHASQQFLTATRRNRTLTSAHTNIIESQKDKLKALVRAIAKAFLLHIDVVVDMLVRELGVHFDEMITFAFPAAPHLVSLDFFAHQELVNGQKVTQILFQVWSGQELGANPDYSRAIRPFNSVQLKEDKDSIEAAIISQLLRVPSVRKCTAFDLMIRSHLHDRPRPQVAQIAQDYMWLIRSHQGIVRRNGIEDFEMLVKEPTYHNYVNSLQKVYKACDNVLEFTRL